MASEISVELKDFILSFFNEHRFKLPIASDKITLQTSIDVDLELYDIDIDLFLGEFFEKFKIDYTEFHWDNHGGYPKSSPIRNWYYRIFFKSKFIEFNAPKLRVADLQNAINEGKLR